MIPATKRMSIDKRCSTKYATKYKQNKEYRTVENKVERNRSTAAKEFKDIPR
jgi:hypothetical protein